MIILDTNVVSEPLKLKPSRAVLDWLDAQEPQTLYLTAINLAELLAGVEVMPSGRKRTALRAALDDDVLPLFEGRILPFDKTAATAFSKINTKLQSAGRSMSFADCAIAAIAQANGFSLATRNIRDFISTEIEIVSPWDFVLD
jgi:toxin FitB